MFFDDRVRLNIFLVISVTKSTLFSKSINRAKSIFTFLLVQFKLFELYGPFDVFHFQFNTIK